MSTVRLMKQVVLQRELLEPAATTASSGAAGGSKGGDNQWSMNTGADQ